MAFWTCGCGAVNGMRSVECEICGDPRAKGASESKPEPISTRKCARCGDESPNTQCFHEDGAPEDRGVRLCPGCWIPALQRRAALDPMNEADRQAWRALLAGKLPVG